MMHDLAQIASALADQSRLAILAALLEGDATVTDLATRLSLPQPRVSSHLTVLRNGGIVSVNTNGRQHSYHVDSTAVEGVLGAPHRLSGSPSALPARSDLSSREVRGDTEIRRARSCYDHLAGVAGVQLLDAMLECGWLRTSGTATRAVYELTPEGRDALLQRGVAVDAVARSRRPLARPCLDWTERRPHLAGSLGAALLDALLEQHVVQRSPHGRALLSKGDAPTRVLEWLSQVPTAAVAS